jgi:FkbM family methyltransferase
MTFISYAQNFEDVMLWRALSTVEDGFYIDVGASEPLADSVTAAFYERGWTGINVEPMAGAYARLAAARTRDINLQLALEEEPGIASYFSVGEGNGISTGVPALGNKYEEENWGVERVAVTVSTLKDVCDKHAQNRAIHFLKIDVEGKERAVLLGGDFSKFRPWVVLVEATLPNSQTPTHQEWEDLLLSQRYSFVYFDGLNRFYIADEKLNELESHFHSPPNWFDHFMRASEATAIQKFVEIDSERALLEGKFGDLAAELKKTTSELRELDAGWRLEKTAREQLERRLEDAVQAQEALTSQVEAYYQETFESSRYIAWLSQERVQLGDRLSRSEIAQQAFAAALREREEQLRSMALQVNEIFGTLSWRITRPLRAIRRMLPR